MTEKKTILIPNPKQHVQSDRGLEIVEALNAQGASVLECIPRVRKTPRSRETEPLIDPKRAALGFALWATKNGELAKYTPNELLRAFIDSMRFGVDLSNPHGHGYIIPFYDRSKGRPVPQFIPGYKGYMHLARRLCGLQTRSGIVCVHAVLEPQEKGGPKRVIKYGDPFEYDPVTQTVQTALCKVGPINRMNPLNFEWAWAIAFDPKQGPRNPSGAIVLDRDQMEYRRLAASKGKHANKLANDWPDRWWNKTAVRMLFSSGQVELDPDGIIAQLTTYDGELDAAAGEIGEEPEEEPKAIEVSKSMGEQALERMGVDPEDPPEPAPEPEPAPDPQPSPEVQEAMRIYGEEPEPEAKEPPKPVHALEKAAEKGRKRAEEEITIRDLIAEIETIDSEQELARLATQKLKKAPKSVQDAVRPKYLEQLEVIRSQEVPF